MCRGVAVLGGTQRIRESSASHGLEIHNRFSAVRPAASGRPRGQLFVLPVGRSSCRACFPVPLPLFHGDALS